MDLAELTSLLTPEGLRLLDELGTVASTDDVAAVVSRLRAAGHAPERVSAVVGQARLRHRAETKFGPFASRMLFTRAGLEQASRLAVAARHAGRFRDAGVRRVADLGCGIGGDSLGLAGIGLEVLAVEADEVTAAIAAYNLAPFADTVTVRHAQAQEVDLTQVDAAWLDPARRTAGHEETRRTSADEWSPPLEWSFDLAARLPTGIKLGPGFDRGRIPSGTDDHPVEAQWITVDGATIELVVWTGALARTGVHRAALVVNGDRAHEMTAPGDSIDEPVRALGEFLHEPAGAVIRARLIGDLARDLDAGMVSDGIAYLTSDTARTSPFAQTFRIRESLPTDVSRLARALRERGVGTLEIKKRGVDVDPARLRTRLKLRGSASATLILTRIGSTRVALLADRV